MKSQPSQNSPQTPLYGSCFGLRFGSLRCAFRPVTFRFVFVSACFSVRFASVRFAGVLASLRLCFCVCSLVSVSFNCSNRGNAGGRRAEAPSAEHRRLLHGGGAGRRHGRAGAEAERNRDEVPA